MGDLGPMLVRGWAVYVENIFRDNFLRFFPPLEAKTMEKPIVFSRRRPCRRPSVGLRVDRNPCNLQCFLALNVTGPKNTVNYRDFCRHAALPRVGGRGGSAYNLRLPPKASGNATGPWPAPGL